jgi:aminodeoxyfutalosine deaminase
MMLLLHRDLGRAVAHHERRFSLRQEGADLPRRVTFLDIDWVGAENAERVAVVSTNDCFHFGSVHGNFDYMALTELHVHLEGTVDRKTALLLDPSLSAEAIDAAWNFSDFAGFLRCFKFVAQRLRGPADYALITRRMIESFALQGIGYAEVTLGAGVILWRGFDFDDVWRAIREAQTAASAATGVEIQWNLDAVRQFGPDHVMEVARLASRYVGDGAISFGIGGDELAGPALTFRAAYGYARDAGLHLTAHAGETDGPESIRAALDIGAERIGHGIRAADDPDLMRRLCDENIPLEVSLTSNVKTGAVASLLEHPLEKLLDAGVRLTLNTDDPGIFETTLAGEFDLAHSVFGLTDDELAALKRNADRYRFYNRQVPA